MPEGWNLYKLIQVAANGDHDPRRLADEALAALPSPAPPLAERLERLESQVGQLARAETVEKGFQILEDAIGRLASGRTDPGDRRETSQ